VPIHRHGRDSYILTIKAAVNKNVIRLRLKQLTVSTSDIKTSKLYQIHVAECVKPYAQKPHELHSDVHTDLAFCSTQ